jgi:hypothetical protein
VDLRGHADPFRLAPKATVTNPIRLTLTRYLIILGILSDVVIGIATLPKASMFLNSALDTGNFFFLEDEQKLYEYFCQW